jgi:hypothetical protein
VRKLRNGFSLIIYDKKSRQSRQKSRSKVQVSLTNGISKQTRFFKVCESQQNDSRLTNWGIASGSELANMCNTNPNAFDWVVDVPGCIELVAVWHGEARNVDEAEKYI